MSDIPTVTDMPCEPWPVDMACTQVLWYAEDDVVPGGVDLAAQLELQDKAVLWASAMLWKRTRRRFGVCTLTRRVCPPRCECVSVCSCGPQSLLLNVSELPITSITSITDVCSGAVVDPARYGIINENSIGIVDGGSCVWSAGGCDVDIVFTDGYTPDVEAVAAVSELTAEYLNYCRGTACRKGSYFDLSGGSVRRGRGGRRDVMLFGLPLVDRFILDATASSPSGMLDAARATAFAVT